MIKAEALCKRFGDVTALDHVDALIPDGSVYGLIGTNGSGKSTFLRIAAGILKPDSGSLTVDGSPVFEHPEIKKQFFYISDDQHFFPNATPEDLRAFTEIFYPAFDRQRFGELLSAFGLDPRRKISTFSKGMKKQLSVILGLSACTRYLFCDETFDGLDPVMRQTVKSLFAEDLSARGLTPVIASHNLRELEDICDHVGLLHKGGILFSRDLEDLKLSIRRVQCVLQPGTEADQIPGLEILKTERRGSLLTLTVRGAEDDILAAFQPLNPIFLELLPLSLEEIFISETEVNGYDVKSLLF